MDSHPAFPILWAAIAALGSGLFAGQAAAVTLALESVTEIDGPRVVRLQVESRVKFDFDPKSKTLRSSGFWTAQHSLGPARLARYTHRVEDFSASAEGGFSVKSYECIEGTMGATLLVANVCSNYRFGPNRLDDGGYGDDVSLGPPKSLDGYRLQVFKWDGERLFITLARGSGATPDEPAASMLKLVFLIEEPYDGDQP